MYHNIESELCAGTDSSPATCHMAAKCGGRDTSFNPCAGAIVLRPDKLAVMTRFQQIAQRPRSHFGELSAAPLQTDSERAHELCKARTHTHQVPKPVGHLDKHAGECSSGS